MVDNLPATLTHLTLGDRFNLTLNNLQYTLQYLDVVWCLKLINKSTNLPIRLKELNCNIMREKIFVKIPLECVVYYYETHRIDRGKYIEDTKIIKLTLMH